MRPWRRREPGDEQPSGNKAGRAALNEFDAFLGGRYIDYLLQNGLAVPTWAWVNEVAHATHDELEAIAAETRYREDQPLALAWQRAIGAIARQLVAEADGDDCRLQELQTQVLVPVELALAQDWDRPVHPAKVRDLVLWTLASRRGG